MNKDLFLGIDTSNYKTSVAIVNGQGDIIKNYSQLLKVEKGERGLRQSTALFQHVNKLPLIFEAALSDKGIRGSIKAIGVSTRPRPINDSYMPVFKVGESFAKVAASSLGVPIFYFSHQEGHVEAIKFFTPHKDTKEIVCFHFSGGTTEAILTGKKRFDIVGGTKDISYGQVLDRIGVSLGMDFPSGQEMDKIALQYAQRTHGNNFFTPIKVNEGFLNLSGIETQGQRIIKDNNNIEKIVYDLFITLSESIIKMINQINQKTNINNYIFAGGVSSSVFIRNYLKENLNSTINIYFGQPALSSDNAVGVALLGRKEYGNKTCNGYATK